MADLLSVIVQMAFQAASRKYIALFFARTQFPVRVHLRVVNQGSLLFILFLSSAAFCVVGQLDVLMFVGDPCYRCWEWLEEVIDRDRLEEGVKVYQGVVHLAAVCSVTAHIKPAECSHVDCVSKFSGKRWQA